MIAPRSRMMALLMSITLGACAGDEAAVASAPALHAEACRALVGDQQTLRGGATAAALGLTIPDSGLVLPSSLTPSGGVLLRDSSIYVFDVELGHIARLDAAGREVARMGRSGRGPGEFSTNGIWTQGRSQFLGAHGDTLVAYDGSSIHRFTPLGAHMDSRPLPAAARPFLELASRFAVEQGTVYAETMRSMVREGGQMTVLPLRQFHVWRIDGDSATSIASIELPQLPRMGTGGFFASPAEARPKWDLRGGCLAMMNGSSDTLHLLDVHTGVRDTLRLPLPERFADAAAMNASLPAALQPAGEPPAPVLLARVDGLLLAPDGVLWLRPVLRLDDVTGGQEAWRYDLGRRRFAFDTVPAFPYAFLPDGRALRLTTDDEGVTRLLPLARLQP